jgi:calcineurin-like phosphoesterase
MKALDSPFYCAANILKTKALGQFVIIDFHAESFAEKEALALYLDGQISILAGTHTHVQTADERILPKGTGYIGDLGMTGPINSVIGFKTDVCIQKNISQMPLKIEVAEGPAILSAALFHIAKDGKCCGIERIQEQCA